MPSSRFSGPSVLIAVLLLLGGFATGTAIAVMDRGGTKTTLSAGQTPSAVPTTYPSVDYTPPPSVTPTPSSSPSPEAVVVATQAPVTTAPEITQDPVVEPTQDPTQDPTQAPTESSRTPSPTPKPTVVHYGTDGLSILLSGPRSAQAGMTYTYTIKVGWNHERPDTYYVTPGSGGVHGHCSKGETTSPGSQSGSFTKTFSVTFGQAGTQTVEGVVQATDCLYYRGFNTDSFDVTVS